MPLNRELLGKVYEDPEPVGVEAEQIAAYARATNTDNRAYFTGIAGEVVAPPIFGVVTSRDVLMRALTDPELGADLMRLLHTEQVMRFHEPIRPGDEVRSRAEIVAFDERTRGEIFELAVRTERSDGTLLYEGLLELFIRRTGAVPQEALRGRDGPEREPAPRPEPDADLLFEAELHVDDDQSLRYAEASGDHNPIHKDDAFARAAGLPGKILHGLCTLAMAQNAIVDRSADGDPRRLRALRGRFARPVLMGDTLLVRAFSLGESGDSHRLAFEVRNGDGKVVVRDGAAEVSR